MDHELKNLVLNINQLAALSGLHRQTEPPRKSWRLNSLRKR